MRVGFYPRLALQGIRKNRQLYLPYLMTCIEMIMMHYIVVFLENCEAVTRMRGGETISSVLELGSWVIAAFAFVFLMYTNSFLMRRRKKEFGLYNILGMDKRNIGKLLFWEVLLTAAFSLAIGLFLGIVFSKLAELGLVTIMQSDVTYTLSLSLAAIRRTALIFLGIFGFLFLGSLFRVRLSSAVALMKSESAGEKPPKGNWLLGLLGAVLLGAAYYLAVTIEEPITAFALFFVAVLLVIAGTYLLMIAGSVLFCRILQKRKNYYYRAKHFVSVSSMVYRMKRNGAGLASICILSTMVLVMISSTTCLYFGEDDSLRSRYPGAINLTIFMKDGSGMAEDHIQGVREEIDAAVRGCGVEPQNVHEYRRMYTAGLLDGNTVETDVTRYENLGMDDYAKVYEFYFMPLSDYNAVTGSRETLESGEALIYTNRSSYRGGDTISFNRCETFRIRKVLEDFPADARMSMSIFEGMVIVVPDLEQSVQKLAGLADFNGNRMVEFRWEYQFDTGMELEQDEKVYTVCADLLADPAFEERSGMEGYGCESREMERADFFLMYGGLFFLGILLSIVFLFAAVLLIYYKQVSEGYEDQARFGIMQKVGMTKREIRKSINSQLLTVFYLPLLMAVCHLAFAFPIIRKLLLLFSLNNVALFAATTGISILVFALFYALVYRITSNTYYRIVSGSI